MITAQFEVTPAFNAGIQNLIRQCRLNARTVVQKETGELIKTLARVSPPKMPSKTRFQIKNTVRRKFEAARAGGGKKAFQQQEGEIGEGGIKFYAFDEQFAYGIFPRLDMRQSPDPAIYNAYYKLNKHGRIIQDFKKPRRQKIALSTKLLVSPAQRNRLIRRIQSHVGRLKAGWLKAVEKGVINIAGGRMPPGWVMRHIHGCRGAFINETARPDQPAFTIINQAKGIGHRKNNMAFYVKLATKARAAAMKTNCLLFMKGKKNIADYSAPTSTVMPIKFMSDEAIYSLNVD